MELVATLVSTGQHIEDDVRAAFTCWNCGGVGYFEVSSFDLDTKAYLPDREEPCEHCHGTGLYILKSV
jgi:hypothetical protein